MSSCSLYSVYVSAAVCTVSNVRCRVCVLPNNQLHLYVACAPVCAFLTVEQYCVCFCCVLRIQDGLVFFSCRGCVCLQRVIIVCALCCVRNDQCNPLLCAWDLLYILHPCLRLSVCVPRFCMHLTHLAMLIRIHVNIQWGGGGCD